MKPLRQSKTHKKLGARRLKSARDDQSTRERLLEVAGQVFAEQGFHRTTGKEICELAGINTAAVNYYYGGIEGLYAAVLHEAHGRFVTFAAASAAIADKTDARAKLEAILGLFVETLLGPKLTSWMLRVIGREVVSPTPMGDQLRNSEFLPKMGIIKAIVSELMGMPGDHPAVERGCVNVLSPCFMMLICDRQNLQRAFPGQALNTQDAKPLVRHLVVYALAGLEAVAREAREGHGPGERQAP